jgi:hypothetical protein
VARTFFPRTSLLLGFCSLALAQAPPQTDWRFAHPDADIKVSVNLQALLSSPSIAKAIEQGKSKAKDNAMQVELALAMLRQVDRASVSMRQKTHGDMDVLVQVTGSFDPQLIAGFFPSTGAGKVKVVGPHTLLIGEGDSFAQAAERMSAGASPAPSGDLEQSDIWIFASHSFLAQQTAAAAPGGGGTQMPPALKGLGDLSVGLNFGDAPEVNVLVTAVDETAAGEMLKTFQDGVSQLAQLNPMAGAAAKAVSLQQDGSRVRIHYVVPPEFVAMAQQQAATGDFAAQLTPLLGSLGMGGFGGAAPAKKPAVAIAPEPPPQNGGKVVIFGLDGGPQELPAH